MAKTHKTFVSIHPLFFCPLFLLAVSCSVIHAPLGPSRALIAACGIPCAGHTCTRPRTTLDLSYTRPEPSVATIMEGVTIPTAVPDDLRKACDSLVKRATEVKRSEPVIAYWCMSPALSSADIRLLRCRPERAQDSQPLGPGHKLPPLAARRPRTGAHDPRAKLTSR